MINIGICDDNIQMLNTLYTLIYNEFKKFTDDFEITKLTNGIVTLNENKLAPFDVLFLDIDMPRMSGFDVAGRLRQIESDCLIIFVTNYAELIYDGMEFHPFQFIRKQCKIPIEDSVRKVVDEIHNNMKQHDSITLEDDLNGKIVTTVQDIVYVESDKHYLIYHLLNGNKEVRMRDSINNFETRYVPYDFVRIHKKYCINLKHLSFFDGKNGEVALGKAGIRLPISKNYKQEVDNRYTLYLRKCL